MLVQTDLIAKIILPRCTLRTTTHNGRIGASTLGVTDDDRVSVAAGERWCGYWLKEGGECNGTQARSATRSAARVAAPLLHASSVAANTHPLPGAP